MYTVKVVENSARVCNRYVTVKIENIYLQNSK